MDELERKILEVLIGSIHVQGLMQYQENSLAKQLAQAILSAGWVKMSVYPVTPKRKRIEKLRYPTDSWKAYVDKVNEIIEAYNEGKE